MVFPHGFSFPFILSNAISVLGSDPIMIMSIVVLFWNVALSFFVFWMSWWLVKMCPSLLMINPDPMLFF